MDWKDKLNALKTKLPEGEEVSIVQEEIKTTQNEPLRIELDKRKGKLATLITAFEGTDEALKELAKLLKMKCNTGGSARDGEILIQGDFREKTAEILTDLGYKIKRINFPTSPTARQTQSNRRKS
jgi:translation initiation factor 1